MPMYEVARIGVTDVRMYITADSYRAGDGFLTFVLDERPIMSLPEERVAYVAEASENGALPFDIRAPKG